VDNQQKPVLTEEPARRLSFGNTCEPPMSARDLGRKCECGHVGRDHHKALPSPCRHGWDQAALRSAVDQNLGCGMGVVLALDEEMDRQRAAGACPCIAFSPAAAVSP